MVKFNGGEMFDPDELKERLVLVHKPKTSSSFHDFFVTNYQTVPPPPTLLSRSYALADWKTICLDSVPYSHLECFVRKFKKSLRSGTHLTINFTTCASSTSLSSPLFVLAVLPFLPRRHIHRNRPGVQADAATKAVFVTDRTARSTASSTAPATLFTSVPQILQLLISGPDTLTVDRLMNVSEARATFLNAYVQDLEIDPLVRDDFVRTWGMEAWREERLLTAWESAALTAKLLEHWSIVVHKR